MDKFDIYVQCEEVFEEEYELTVVQWLGYQVLSLVTKVRILVESFEM